MFYRELSPKSKSKPARRLGLLFAASLLFYLIFLWLFVTRENWIWWLLALPLFLIPTAALWFFAYSRPLFFKSDVDRITYRVSWGLRGVRTLSWRNIDAIRIGPLYVRFYIRGRKPRQIELGDLHYTELRQLKADLRDEAKRREIEVVEVPILHEEK